MFNLNYLIINKQQYIVYYYYIIIPTLNVKNNKVYKFNKKKYFFPLDVEDPCLGKGT